MQNLSHDEDGRRLGGLSVCLGVAATLTAVGFRLLHIRGSRFTEPDEFRAVIMEPDAPLFSLVHRLSASVFGTTHGVALATNGATGAAVVALVIILGSRMVGITSALIAALLLAVSTIDVRYSRSGYPCVLATLWIFVAAVKAFEGVQKVNSFAPFAAAGIAAACAFMTYVPSYASCGAIPIVAVLALVHGGANARTIARNVAAFGIAGVSTAVIVISLFTVILTGRIQILGYFESLSDYKNSTLTFIDPNSISLTAFFDEWSRLDGIGVSVAILCLAAIGAVILWRTKRPPARFIVAFPFLAAMLYGGMAVSGFHTLYSRHFVFTLPFIVLLAGVAISTMKQRWIASLVLSGLCVSSAYQSCLLAGRTFTVEPIRAFVAGRGIRLPQIASMLELHDPGDREKTKRLPYFYTQPNRTAPMIDWDKLMRMRRDEGVKYLITSGLGSRSPLGFRDPVLMKLAPLATWRHPYRSDEAQNPTLQDFALYSLDSLTLEGQ